MWQRSDKSNLVIILLVVEVSATKAIDEHSYTFIITAGVSGLDQCSLYIFIVLQCWLLLQATACKVRPTISQTNALHFGQKMTYSSVLFEK